MAGKLPNIQAVKQWLYANGAVAVEIGNMPLSMANTITALDNGADMVDGTYTGIGRGGGNLPLELITLYLNISKNYNLDLNSLFKYLDNTMTEIISKEKTKILHAISKINFSKIFYNIFSYYLIFNFILC